MQVSAKKGNPAHAIRERYQELMAIEDLAELRARAEAIIAAGGISTANQRRARLAIAQAGCLDRLRGFLTNFLLAADGLAVL